MALKSRFYAALVCALFGAFAVVAGNSTPSFASSPSVLDVAVVDCPLHCDHCNIQHTEHLVHISAPGAYGGFQHADCFPGSCNGHDCEAEEESDASTSYAFQDSFVEAWADYRAAAPADVPRVVNAHPRYFRVNTTRQALQVLNCNGEVFAHIPLEEADWTRLVATTSRSVLIE